MSRTIRRNKQKKGTYRKYPKSFFITQYYRHDLQGEDRIQEYERLKKENQAFFKRFNMGKGYNYDDLPAAFLRNLRRSYRRYSNSQVNQEVPMKLSMRKYYSSFGRFC